MADEDVTHHAAQLFGLGRLWEKVDWDQIKSIDLSETICKYTKVRIGSKVTLAELEPEPARPGSARQHPPPAASANRMGLVQREMDYPFGFGYVAIVPQSNNFRIFIGRLLVRCCARIIPGHHIINIGGVEVLGDEEFLAGVREIEEYIRDDPTGGGEHWDSLKTKYLLYNSGERYRFYPVLARSLVKSP